MTNLALRTTTGTRPEENVLYLKKNGVKKSSTIAYIKDYEISLIMRTWSYEKFKMLIISNPYIK